MADLGYDPSFLDTDIAPPQAPVPGPDDDPALATPLDYVHFTIRMHPERRLAWWVAWNVDGLRLFPGDSISRSGERFRLDPRIPAGAQTGEAVYAANDLDRGHVARRSDLLWGTLDEARLANTASFYFTNITPQHQDFNQSGRGGVWGLLENAVLALEGLEERRLTVFAGPVLDPEDPPYRGVQLPVEHWKVVVYRLDGRLRAKAFVLTQDLDGLERVAPDFLDDFDTYLVPLELLEERTGLTFAGLRDAVEPEGLVLAGPVLVTDAEEVGW
jgi:endonuclease G